MKINSGIVYSFDLEGILKTNGCGPSGEVHLSAEGGTARGRRTSAVRQSTSNGTEMIKEEGSTKKVLVFACFPCAYRDASRIFDVCYVAASTILKKMAPVWRRNAAIMHARGSPVWGCFCARVQ